MLTVTLAFHLPARVKARKNTIYEGGHSLTFSDSDDVNLRRLLANH